jgi:hypothetical protein
MSDERTAEVPATTGTPGSGDRDETTEARR